MNKDTRIKKIQEVIDRRQPITSMEILWEGKLQTRDVFNIPLEYLVYNKYNGRILSRTKSLERQNHLLDPEPPEGKKIIEDLLFESHKDRNAKTLKNITEFGQLKVGIITRDGIIIDGNRRAMLLNRIEKYDYFKAVVLPVTLEENPLEIERLETSYQMGEDEKLGYNANEKYIKAKEIYLKLTGEEDINVKNLSEDAIKKISDWMGEDTKEVVRYLETIVLMEEYLWRWEYDGIYTQLDKREDQFISLHKWLSTFYEKDSAKAFDGYADTDVDDLKSIAFDYLRCSFEGKRFRTLADGNRNNHFFGNKEIWSSFRDIHKEIIDQLPNESPIEYDSNNLVAHLNDRDKRFYKSADFGPNEDDNRFVENFANHEEQLGYNRAADKPGELVKKAQHSFDSININHKAFLHPDVQNQVAALGDKIFDSLQKKSPSKVLDHVISLLSKFDLSNITDKDKDDIKTKLKDISSLAYNINRKL
jgi:hypothetical protein